MDGPHRSVLSSFSVSQVEEGSLFRQRLFCPAFRDFISSLSSSHFHSGSTSQSTISHDCSLYLVLNGSIPKIDSQSHSQNMNRAGSSAGRAVGNYESLLADPARDAGPCEDKRDSDSQAPNSNLGQPIHSSL